MEKGLFLKKFWLEIIFTILFVVLVYMSLGNHFPRAHIDYNKKLIQSDTTFSNVSMSEYLSEIEKINTLTTVIVVKDIQGFFIPDITINQLKHMGFDRADLLSEDLYHCFIGIWADGKVVYQQVGGDESISYGQFVGDHYILAKSATLNTGNVGEVYIDDVQYSVNNRGFNIVTIDNITNELVDSVSYDTHELGVPLYRLINGKVEMVLSKTEE